MIIEAQNKEFFLNNPTAIHYVPFKHEESNGEYIIISDNYSGSLLLGKYRDRGRTMEVYEEIKKQEIRRKKYYLMPRE